MVKDRSADEGLMKALSSVVEVVVALKGVLCVRQRLQNVRMLWPRNKAQELISIHFQCPGLVCKL